MISSIHLFFLLLSFICPLIASHQTDVKESMSFLVVVPSFPKIHDVCMLNFITGLIDRGHKVHIYALNEGDFINVQQDVIDYDLVNKTFFKKLPHSHSLRKYDVIVFQLGHLLFDVKKRRKFKGKVAVCLRGYDVTGFLRENPHAYKKHFDSCDLFMPVCEAFKKILINIGCPSEKIAVHHSSIDCSKFTFKEREMPRHGIINIVSAGRFVEKKGFEYAIRAVAQLIKKYPRIRYTIIGAGQLKEKYQDLIQELNIEDYITLDNWHAHEEYIDILNNAHIFILPSVTAQNNDQEGIPNVLKEAMAMGLLVVATDHSGNSELIEDGISGYLVPERDSDAIVQAIDNLLNSPEQWKSMQLVAVDKIHREFDKEKENDKLEQLFYKLLEKKERL
jgi:colanic acid/amylovoran biosynthesis glycosyltransferase